MQIIQEMGKAVAVVLNQEEFEKNGLPTIRVIVVNENGDTIDWFGLAVEHNSNDEESENANL